jgi:FixJ family two-component response regulator
MPRMDGREVWHFIRRIRPDMPVVISSGFHEAEAMRQFDDPTLLFVQKPYTCSTLLAKMEAALARRK